MARWITKTHAAVTSSGANAQIEFTPATAGNLLIAVVAARTLLTTPVGWTEESSAVGDGVLYVWRRTAEAGDSTIDTVRGVAGEPLMAVVYEFTPATEIIASAPQVNFNVTGVAVDGLSGLPSTEKLLIHAGIYDPSAPTVEVDQVYIDDFQYVDIWEQAANGTGQVRLVVGFVEDSTVASWAPTVYLGTTTGGSFHWFTQRMTLALSVGAGPEPEPPVARSGIYMRTEAGKVEIPPLQMRR